MTTLRNDIVAKLAKYFSRHEDNDASPDPTGPATKLILGGAVAESLIGDAGADIISGGAGGDSLRGDGGDDAINGTVQFSLGYAFAHFQIDLDKFTRYFRKHHVACHTTEYQTKCDDEKGYEKCKRHIPEFQAPT